MNRGLRLSVPRISWPVSTELSIKAVAKPEIPLASPANSTLPAHSITASQRDLNLWLFAYPNRGFSEV